MFVGCPLADVMDVNLQQSALAGALDHAGVDIWFENLGQDGEDVKAHEYIVARVDSRVGVHVINVSYACCKGEVRVNSR